MILTLTVKLFYGDWTATLEIEGSDTLEDLHLAIQDAVDFDNDHLYEFYIARTLRSRDRIRYDNEEVTLDSIFPLATGKKLFYLFDYGNSWYFQIGSGRKRPFPAVVGIQYPRIIAESGTKPQQYPDWEEEEDNDDDD